MATTKEPVPKVQSEVRAGSLFRAHGEGHHQCWYPVGLSRDLGVGERFGTEFCDGRIVVYRGADGVARAMSPYCAHMGSDLGIGCVVGNDLECAFHHWRYGPDGRCTVIPTGDRIPQAARVFSFPTEERYGIVWVFLGEDPLYEVPSFPGGLDESTLLIHAFEGPYREPLRVEPWVFTSNVFDLVHNRVVHGIQIEDPDLEWITPYVCAFQWEMTFKERAEGTWQTDIRVYGTNALGNVGRRDGRLKLQVVGGTWMGEKGTRSFFALATDDSPGGHEYLEEQEQLHSRLINEDLPILNTLRMGNDHFVAADRNIVRFLRFARDYPRTTVAALEAGATAK